MNRFSNRQIEFRGEKQWWCHLKSVDRDGRWDDKTFKSKSSASVFPSLRSTHCDGSSAYMQLFRVHGSRPAVGHLARLRWLLSSTTTKRWTGSARSDSVPRVRHFVWPDRARSRGWSRCSQPIRILRHSPSKIGLRLQLLLELKNSLDFFFFVGVLECSSWEPHWQAWPQLTPACHYHAAAAAAGN